MGKKVYGVLKLYGNPGWYGDTIVIDTGANAD